MFIFQVRLESIGAEDICDGNNRYVQRKLWFTVIHFIL